MTAGRADNRREGGVRVYLTLAARPAACPRPELEGTPAMGHHGQHATCPKCGTDQPYTISGNLARHDPDGGTVTSLNRSCRGSGMTRRDIAKAEKGNAR